MEVPKFVTDLGTSVTDLVKSKLGTVHYPYKLTRFEELTVKSAGGTLHAKEVACNNKGGRGTFS